MKWTSFQSQLGYQFCDEQLLKVALTHKSSRQKQFNERLEYLGDAVLELTVSEWLYREFPGCDEGDLTKMRAILVNAGSLADWARSLDLERHLIQGRREEKRQSSDRVLSSGLEAVLGALFLDGGYNAVRLIVDQRMKEVPVESIEVEFDAKSKLQELVQSEFKQTPVYQIVEESGPAHSREFVAIVIYNEVEMGRGSGRSKRDAEQQAAKSAMESFNEQ